MSSGGAQSAERDMILIPKEAQARVEEATARNQDLSMIYDAQDAVLSDLSDSLPDPSSIAKELDDVEIRLKSTNETLTNAQSALVNILSKSEESRNAPAGEILRNVITQTMNTFQEMALVAVRDGHPVAGIFDIIDVEDQMQKIIDDLSERGMFPESESDAAERIEQVQAHTKKIIDFLKTLQDPQ